jgi:hypothetical protein
MMTDQEAIAAEILRQTAARGADGSISPSEVARALAPEEEAWRRLLGPIRAAAIRLAREGRIEVLRKGRPADPAGGIRGVIRLRVAAPAAQDDARSPVDKG